MECLVVQRQWLTKRCELDFVDILTIDKDLPERVESVKQTEDSGFTTTWRYNDSYLLAGRDRKTKILENESVGMISKRDVIKLDGNLSLLSCRDWALGAFFQVVIVKKKVEDFSINLTFGGEFSSTSSYNTPITNRFCLISLCISILKIQRQRKRSVGSPSPHHHRHGSCQIQ